MNGQGICTAFPSIPSRLSHGWLGVRGTRHSRVASLSQGGHMIYIHAKKHLDNLWDRWNFRKRDERSVLHSIVHRDR
jgi:hypothetical protein